MIEIFRGVSSFIEDNSLKVDALKVPPSLTVEDALKVLAPCREDNCIVPVYMDETVKVLFLMVDALKVLS